VGKKPDIVTRLPDGSTEEIRYRKTPSPTGHRSRIRKIIGPDGKTREVWHEVLRRDGTIIHQHEKPVRSEGDADAG
jgi:hypothetical protein